MFRIQLVCVYLLSLLFSPQAEARRNRPADCVRVTIDRSEVIKAHAQITVRGAGQHLIEQCNRGNPHVIGVVPSPTVGVQMRLFIPREKGFVYLPRQLKAAVISQTFCDVVDGKLTYGYYRFEWDKRIPRKIELSRRDPRTLNADPEYFRKGCLAVLPDFKRKELDAASQPPDPPGIEKKEDGVQDEAVGGEAV